MDPSHPLGDADVILTQLHRIARRIQHDRYRQPGINDKLLPYLNREVHSLLYCDGDDLAWIAQEIIDLTSGDKKVDLQKQQPRIEEIETIERDLQATNESLEETRALVRGLAAIVEVLKANDCLSDGNKAAYEDLERLAKDCEEDLVRVKEMLEEVER